MSLAEEANSLIQAGRPQEALELLVKPATAPEADSRTVSAYAWALKGVGRLEDSLATYQRVLASSPKSGVAEHNVASLLGDLHRDAEAVEHARRAIAKGQSGPDTWLVLGRALVGLGRLQEARQALETAAAGRPGWYDALRDLAQLIWMTTGDLDAALAPVEKALSRFPHHPILSILAAKVEQYGGRQQAALDRLLATVSHNPPHFDLEIAVSALAQKLDRPALALEHAGLALKLERTSVQGGVRACDAFLALGEPNRAVRMVEPLLQRNPDDQELLSRIATAWRMLGDPRYAALYDYEALVGVHTLDVPAGWADLASYLADLVAALKRMHPFGAHPFDQSLRHGSQTPTDLRDMPDPAIRAFYQAIDGPVRRHIAGLGNGGDPLRRRATSDYKVAGAWSVWLQPNGFHVDHVHPMGWLSSACYLELPEAVGAGGREGWIKFGEPGVVTSPALPAEHYVKPEPGMLVLFPSYMWHGTAPFSGESRRLTCAFDVVPA